jgi:hypothetical protein
MPKVTGTKPVAFRLSGDRVRLGRRVDLTVPVAESYSGETIEIPVYVWRGRKSGPAVLVCATVHGDELNAIGVIRRLILDPPFELAAGTGPSPLSGARQQDQMSARGCDRGG